MCYLFNDWFVGRMPIYTYIHLLYKLYGCKEYVYGVQQLSHAQFSATPWTQPARLLCPQASAYKNSGVGCHALLQKIFQPRDQTCISYVSCIGRRVLYHQHHLGSPGGGLSKTKKSFGQFLLKAFYVVPQWEHVTLFTCILQDLYSVVTQKFLCTSCLNCIQIY